MSVKFLKNHLSIYKHCKRLSHTYADDTSKHAS